MSEALMRVEGDAAVEPAGHIMLNRETIDLIKKQVCPAGITDAEFGVFIETCKRSGLDPLQKQIFCVPRKSKVGGQWVERQEAQPAEAGMLARAERFPDFRGIQAAAVYSEDSCEIDAAAGAVKHVFRPFTKRGVLRGGWARVERAGRTPVVVAVSVEERKQEYGGWQKMPETMMVKCARVACLRVAYPEAFGGLYIKEEMPPEAAIALPQTETPAPVLDASPPAAQTDIAEVLTDEQEMELEIVSCSTLDDLSALVPRLKALPDGDAKARLRAVYNKKRGEVQP